MKKLYDVMTDIITPSYSLVVFLTLACIVTYSVTNCSLQDTIVSVLLGWVVGRVMAVLFMKVIE